MEPFWAKKRRKGQKSRETALFTANPRFFGKEAWKGGSGEFRENFANLARISGDFFREGGGSFRVKFRANFARANFRANFARISRDSPREFRETRAKFARKPRNFENTFVQHPTGKFWVMFKKHYKNRHFQHIFKSKKLKKNGHF